MTPGCSEVYKTAPIGVEFPQSRLCRNFAFHTMHFIKATLVALFPVAYVSAASAAIPVIAGEGSALGARMPCNPVSDGMCSLCLDYD